jgi:glycine cleavage system H protein
MDINKDVKYAKTHEWVRKEGEHYVLGVSDYAQSLLKDIVFIELPSVGTSFEKGDKLADIESVKAVEELRAPMAGEVVEINEELEDNAELVNESPYEDGWFMKIKANDSAEYDDLLSPEDYEKIVEKEGEH